MLTSPRPKARCYYYKELGHTLLHREALATSQFKQIFTVRQMASHRIEGSQHQDRGPYKRLLLSRMYKNVNVKKPMCIETYYMQVLSYVHSHVIVFHPHNNSVRKTLLLPLLKVRRRRHRKVKRLAQDSQLLMVVLGFRPRLPGSRTELILLFCRFAFNI